MYNMKKSLLAMLLLIAMITTQAAAFAETNLPYDTYNYDYWDNIVYTPAAYVPKGSLQGSGLTWNGAPLGDFNAPQDMCVASPSGDIYIADTNNHRVVVLDDTMTTVLNVYDKFDNAGTADGLKSPKGVAVTETDDGVTIYVADSENQRIVALDGEGKLLRVVEIPQITPSVKAKVGGTSYTVGTFIEGMTDVQKTAAASTGENWAAVNVTTGGATAVTNEANGQTYTISAEHELLKPFEAQTVVNGLTYTAAEDGASVTRTGDGETFTYSKYDPILNKDIFTYIGRLIAGTTYSKLSGVKGVYVDEDDVLYAASDKSVTALDEDCDLERVYSGYKNGSNTASFTNITEYAVTEDLVIVRNGPNDIVALNKDGDLEALVNSNAITVTNAEGEVVATVTGYELDGENVKFKDLVALEIIGDKLMAGQKDGTVLILDMDGKLIRKVENNTVIAMDADSVITGEITTVALERSEERFTGLTGVAMLGDQLCIMDADNRTYVVKAPETEDALWTAEQVVQNNSVIEKDRNDAVTRVISSAMIEGEEKAFAQINGVEGVAFNTAQQLCIADSEDRLIVLAADGSVARVGVNPNSEALDANFKFVPLKVSVDYAGRIYCIAQNMFEGIMVFETNNDFTGFFGTIQVSISTWDKFWRKLATKEERSKQALFIPTEFTGIDIDAEGFVYASNVDTTGIQAVRRLNPKGEDVIRMGLNANLGGDIAINGTANTAGPSKIVDVVYRDKGVYSLLDSKRGRIFTYDHEGNLLYIFGGLGTQAGTMQTPVAIEYAKDRILTLDAKQNAILIFGETEYGRLINDAVGLRYDGDETKAVALWQEVLRLDENNELANSGIGKAYLSAGENELAMEYLERGMNREYYSVAFKRYRNEIFKDNIDYFLTGGIVLVVVAVVYFKVIKPKMKKKREGRV